MMTFSVIRLQTRVRGHQAQCHLQILRQERKEIEQERMVVQNAAANAIVSGININNYFVCPMLLSSLFLSLPK